MRLLLLVPCLLITAITHAETCETVIASDGNTYAPRRDTLSMARPFFPDEGGWQFGHDLIGNFFALRIDGRFVRLTVNGYDLMGHRPDGTAEVIGHIRPDARVVDGEGAYPTLEHALNLAANVAVDFELRERNGHRSWVAVFR